MTIRVSDTFTGAAGTLLTAHTGETGATWSLGQGYPGLANPVIDSTGLRIKGGTGAGALAFASGLTTLDGEYGEITVDILSANCGFGAWTRAHPNVGGQAVGYMAYFNAGTVKILRLNGTNFTTIAGPVACAVPISNGNLARITSTGTGTSVQLDVAWNGAAVLSGADTSAGRLVTPNGTAVYFEEVGSDSQYAHVTAVSLVDAAGATVTGVTVTPSTSAVAGGATQQFSASVAGTGSPSQSVSWTCNVGSITSGGLFTAPTATGSTQTATITATSSQDSTKSGAATATTAATSSTVSGVTVTPATATVSAGFTQQFAASVTGTGSPSQAVTWSTNIGSVNSSGVYTAPSGTGSDRTATVTATSQQDGTKTSTATVTIPATVGPTNFVLPHYADAVRETVSAINGNTLTLSGTVPQGYRTFSAAFPNATTGIPVRVEEASTANWVLADVTLTGAAQLTVTRIYAGSNSGNMPAFGSGAKSAFCVLPASQIVRRDWIDGNAYGIDPTFTADCTAGVQQAVLDAYALDVGVIRYSPGHYKLSGPLVTNVAGYNPNSQIYIPQTREGAPNKTIIIEGLNPPNFEAQILRNVPPPTNGVVFESTIMGSGVRPAVFAMVPGNSGDTTGWQFNYTNIGFEKLGIRTNVKNGANPMNALNLMEANQVVKLDLLRLDINMGLLESPSPAAVGSAGLIGPRRYNHLLFNGGCVYASGYTTGAVMYEHMYFNNLTIIGVINLLSLESSDHASYIGLLSGEGYVNGIVQNGNHGLAIGQLDLEHLTIAGSWFQFQKDVKWISGTRPLTVLQCTVVVSNVGVSDAAFVKDANAVVKIVSGAGAN